MESNIFNFNEEIMPENTSDKSYRKILTMSQVKSLFNEILIPYTN